MTKASRPAAAALVAASLALGLWPAACVGTTGAAKISFEATIAGAPPPGPTYTFDNDYGWSVTLSRADVLVGPIYLNTIQPLSQTARLWRALSPVKLAHADDSHLGAGRVVGEVLGQVRFSALSDRPVVFPVAGTVSEEQVRSAEIWFYPPATVAPETAKVDIPALDVEGVARRGPDEVKFKGRLLLDDAWLPDIAPGDKGAQTLTSIRQVRGIPASFVPTEGGQLALSVDPRRLLRGADFANLTNNPQDPADPSARLLVQAKTGKYTTDQVMRVMYNALRSSSGTYGVRWLER